MRVLLSAAASPAAISIVQHLQRLGHEVTGMDASLAAEPLGRAFCDHFYLAPLANAPAYLPFLATLLAQVDVFLPFLDEELVVLAEQGHQLPDALRARIAMSPPDVLLDCVDKSRFQTRCEMAGLPVAPRARSHPAVFKPRFGRGGKGVLMLDDAAIFAAVQSRDGVIQHCVQGEEFTVDAVFDTAGRLLATSARKRVLAAGVSTIGQVMPDTALHALAVRLGQVWSFRYAINFQVIRDVEGQDWLIELNPRLAGSALFSAKAGCDPFAATLALMRGEAWAGQARPLSVWRYWQDWVLDV